jgi:citrate lyase subunit beta/citryl-CoA lyase
MAPRILARWRAAGKVAAVRINPLDSGGMADLEAIMPGHPHAVLMAMVTEPDQIRRLDTLIGDHERRLGIAEGTTEIVPNIETCAGLVKTGAIVSASARVTAALVAAEDMANDLGAERTTDCRELSYPRQRFLVECVAAGVVAIDCPYTFRGLDEAERDLLWARSLGYRAKSVVNLDQIGLVNRILTPSEQERAQAEAMVAAFDAGRARGEDRVLVNGLMVEVPTYRAAKRLIARHAELAAFT